MKRLPYKCDHCHNPESRNNRLHSFHDRSVLLCQNCLTRELERESIGLRQTPKWIVQIRLVDHQWMF
jgi:hypothetical protein